jgi:tetratricopeptide (TPR) repeat protein
MAPEQHQGSEADARADQYSFCLSLYEALFGAMPFRTSTFEAFRSDLLVGRFAEPPSGARVPRWLRQVLVRGLAVRPGDRHPSMAALLTALRKDPGVAWRARLRVGAAVLVLVAAALGWRAQVRHQLRACQGAEQKLDGVWDPARRAAVRNAFLATGKPFSRSVAQVVERAFDEYARAWVAMHTDACEATHARGEQSQELLDLRMACLSDRLTQVKTLTELYTHADADAVERAASTVAALPPLAACADAAALRAPVAPPADPQTRARVEALRERLAQSNALRLAAKYDEGTRVASAALAEAQAMSYRPLEAEARLQLGQLLDDHGDYVEATRSFRKAFAAALEGRHEVVQAWSAVSLIQELGYRQSHFDEAEEWAELAEAAVKRLPREDELRGALYTRRAKLREHAGKYEQALVDGKHALDEEVRTLGPDHLAVAETYQVLGRIDLQLGRYPDSLDDTRRALAIYERKLGPDHPLVAQQWVGIGDAEGLSGDHDRALVEYRKALEVFERISPDHPKIAAIYSDMGGEYLNSNRPREAMEYYRRSLDDREKNGLTLELAEGYSNFAGVELELGQPAAALGHLVQALEVCEKVVGPKHDQCGIVHEAMGEAQRQLGRLDEAIAQFEQGIAIISEAAGSAHPYLVYGLVGLAKVHDARGEPAKSVSVLERAVAIASTHPDAVELATARFDLAQELWSTGARERARSVAVQAHDCLATLTAKDARQLLTKIDAWQAKHR